MYIEKVLIEVRRNLRCAHIFLSFGKCFTESPDSLKIVLNSNEILIKNNKIAYTINVEKYFEIETTSLSCLLVFGKNVSFCINITEDASSMEFILKENDDILQNNLKIALRESEPCQITGKNCRAPLMAEPMIFNRILPLPSGSIAINDWFCHVGSRLENNLAPKLKDLFYGLHHILIDQDCCCNFRIANQYIYCKKCLKFLGQLLFNNKTIKLWNDCISLLNSGNECSFFITDSIKKSIYEIVVKTLFECNLTPQLHFIQFAKILFDTVLSSRKKIFLMLNILETKIEILTISKYNNCNLKLNKNNGFKALFRIEEDNEQPLLSYWKNDMNIHSISLSYKMFDELSMKC